MFFFSSESNNLLEDLHIPDSHLIDDDAAELALIGIYLSIYTYMYINKYEYLLIKNKKNRSKYIWRITQSGWMFT